MKKREMRKNSIEFFHIPFLIFKAKRKCISKKSIYLPHGAILGVDGIADGRKIIKNVTIETIKSPSSLGLVTDSYEIVYEGPTREACRRFPRNVNVHVTIALAGIGFDRTQSKIIADPSVKTNSHIVHVEGDGMNFEIHISSEANGAVTGKYTPYSAVSSMHRVLLLWLTYMEG